MNKFITTFTAIALSLSAIAQQNWTTYPIDIKRVHIEQHGNLTWEILDGNPTVTIRNTGVNDTLGFIQIATPARDSVAIEFTLKLEDLPPTEILGGAIVMQMSVTGPNEGGAVTPLVNIEYSIDGINFLKPVRTVIKPTHTAWPFNGFAIPRTAKYIRYTHAIWNSSQSVWTHNFRFQIGEYLPIPLPKKEFWYNFGEKGEFGFVNKASNWRSEMGSNTLFQTKGLSENFSTQFLTEIPSFFGPLRITDMEDLHGTGRMSVGICCRSSTNLGITTILGGDAMVAQPDGTYKHIIDGVIIPNLDLNRDGRLDFLYKDQNQNIIAYQQFGGLFSETFMHSMTFAEFHNEVVVEEDEWVVSVARVMQGKSLPPSTQFPPRGGVLENTHGSGTVMGRGTNQIATAFADLNKDGIPDLLDPGSGLMYYGMGNNTFVMSSLDGNVISRDLTGNGISDYIVYGGSTNTITAYIYEGEGRFRTQVLMRNLAPDAEIYLYDFDKDGHIDVLITFSSHRNNGTAYIFFAKNDGNGNFDVENESLLTIMNGDYKFATVADVDNDGYFDLFMIHFPGTAGNTGQGVTGTAEIQVMRGKPNFQWEPAETLFTMPFSLDRRPANIRASYDAWRLNVADIDRSGNNVIWLEEGYRTTGLGGVEGSITTGHLHRYNNTVFNTPPEKPEPPTLRYNAGAGQLDISWLLGSDLESSPVDLTYALRVGTAPGLDDVFHAHAFPCGARKNFRPGNMGSELSHTFDVRSWNPGTYYISVQAIDPMFLGSEFSDYATFTQTYLPNQFTIARTNQGSVTAFDTLEIHYSQFPDSDLIYTWDFAGAEVVDSTLGQFKLRWAEAGEKTVSLTVAFNELVSDRFDISLFVLPNKLTWDDSASLSLYVGSPSNMTALNYPLADVNMDGHLDVVAGGVNALRLNNGNGRFTTATGVWNPTFNPTNVQFLDINNDGRLDIFYHQNNEARYLRHSNTAIGSFGISFQDLNDYRFMQGTTERTWSQVLGWGFLMDLTNNGQFDLPARSSGTSIDYFNEGRGNNRLRGVTSFQGAYNRQWVDFNKDGFMDFVALEAVTRNGRAVLDLRFYENLGTGSITDGYVNPEPFRRLPRLQRQDLPLSYGGSSPEGAWLVADMNANGFYDIVYLKPINQGRTDGIVIEWNNQNQGFGAPQEFLIDPSIGEIGHPFAISAFDFDNNGYLDIITSVIDRRDGRNKPYIFYFDENGLMAQGFLYDGNANSAMGRTSAFADIDGDGIPDFFGGIATLRRFRPEWNDFVSYTSPLTKMQSVSTNTPPHAPTNVIAQQTEKGLVIEWDPAFDAETPFALMRYNLSVKQRGAGVVENAYIISPLNDGNTNMAVMPRYFNLQNPVQFHRYISATRFFIPESVLSGELEIMVQAIDQWDAQSPFSEPIFVKISESVSLAMSSQACFDEPITVTYTGVRTGTPVWDFGGATVVSGTNWGPYEIKWNTPGIKTVRVTVGTETTELQTLVHDDLAPSFEMPSEMFVDTRYEFTYPFLLPRENNFSFRLLVRAQDQGRYPPSNMEVRASFGETTGTIQFRDMGFYNPIQVQMHVNVAHNVCTRVFTQQIQLMPRAEAPHIEFLAQTNGRLEVRWDTAFMDRRIDTIVIYKEGMDFNRFNEIGRVHKNEMGFVDVSSNLNIRSEAYRIAGVLPGGITTFWSDPHQSPRLTITRNETANTLIWSAYIGTRINNFTVLRGATPDNLTAISVLPGHRVFFVDNNPNPDELFYALQYDPIPSSDFRAPRPRFASSPSRSPASPPVVRSNVVFAGDASQTVWITNMNILAVQSPVALTGEQRSLFLYTEVFPTNATHQNVEWSIVMGGDRASINATTGVLTGFPGTTAGTVRVRAVATDGSDVSVERNISISAFSIPCELPSNLFLEQLTDSTVSLMWNGSNNSYIVSYFDTLARTTIYTKHTTERFYNLDYTDFPRSGVYMWRVRGVCGIGTDTTLSVIVEGELFTIEITPPPIPPTTFAVNIVQSAGGTVTVMDGEIPVTSGMQVDSATVLTLTATPNTGHEFTQWWDGITTLPRNFTLSGIANISAIFTDTTTTPPPPPLPTYMVTIPTPSNGTITVMNGIVPVTSGAVLDSGTVLTLTATPATGYNFTQWWDGSTTTPRNFTLSGHVNISATFTLQGTPPPTQYRVNITQPNPNHGTITVTRSAGGTGGAGGSIPVPHGSMVDSGTILTLTAIPDTSYNFTQWWDGNTTSPRSFTLTSGVNISATFTPTSTSIQVAAGENMLTVYPNPVNYELRIVIPSEARDLFANQTVELFDMNGRRVASTPLSHRSLSGVEGNVFTIDMSPFQPGNYILRIGNHTVKILKQ